MSIDKLMSMPGASAAKAPAERAVRTGTGMQGRIVQKTSSGATQQALPDLESVAQRIESYMQSVHRALEFRVDDQSGRTVVTVRDSVSGEVIRQIPSEEVLRLAQMAEDQTIVLVNEKT